MKSISIKGRNYVEVNERLKYFRENYKNWTLESEIISLENGVCVIKATVKNESGTVIATGHAYEKEGSSFINSTSFIENCETSAWGRALGNLGIGIDTSIASAEEILNAQINQKKKPDEVIPINLKQPTEEELCKELNQITKVDDLKAFCQKYEKLAKDKGYKKMIAQANERYSLLVADSEVKNGK